MFFILYHPIDILLLLLIIPNLQFAKRAVLSNTFIQRLQSLLIGAFFFTKSNIIHARGCILPVLSEKRFAFARYECQLESEPRARLILSHLSTVLRMIQTVGVSIHIKDIGSECKTVYQSCHHGGVFEKICPFRKRQVSGDDDASALASVSNNFK